MAATNDRHHVLVADDDEEMREVLEFKLRADHEVTTTANGEECWEFLDERGDDPPDVVVLDVMMPKLDGYQVLERVEGDDRFADVSSIMLTARGQESDVVEALDAGAADYVTKPFSPTELLARIETTLG
jgi:DNA-binding response OmpR family regulator